MKQRIHLLAAVVIVAFSSAYTMSQRNLTAGSVQNSDQGVPKPTATIAYKRSVPRPNWDMKYKSGSFKLEHGQWLKGAFMSGGTSHVATRAAFSVEQLRESYTQITPILTITSDQLRAVYFDSKAEKDSKIVQRMTRSGCHYAESFMPKDQATAAPQLFVAWLLTRGSISRAVEHLTGRHPVQLFWTAGDSQNEIVFTVNDCEYASFLANLRWFAGNRWQEIGHQLKR